MKLRFITTLGKLRNTVRRAVIKMDFLVLYVAATILLVSLSVFFLVCPNHLGKLVWFSYFPNHTPAVALLSSPSMEPK